MTLTKEWLQQTIAELEEERDAIPGAVNEDAAMALAAMKLALASMTTEPALIVGDGGDALAYRRLIQTFAPGTKLYTAPPAPVVPDEIQKLKDGRGFRYVKAGVHYSVNYANGWNQCRAAMLQGEAKPGQPDELREDFDFDRFNDAVWLEAVASNPHMHSPTTSTIAMVALELNKRLESGNSPAIPDGWVACSERMPAKGQEVLCTDQFENYETALYDTGYIPGPPFFATTAGEFHPTHWMPLPAAPQQDAKTI